MRTKAAMLHKVAEIRAQAGAVTDPHIRAQLLSVAAHYALMADHHERTVGTIVLQPPEPPLLLS
jgi:hypothetical protein